MAKAIILAAGQGTRLRPLTNEIPKCLVELCGTSLLDRQIAVLKLCGVHEPVIVAGYRANALAERGHSYVVNSAFDRTNMVATLFSARRQFPTHEDLLICYGDIVYQSDNLRAVLAAEERVALMADRQWQRYWQLRMADPLDDVESFVIDDRGFVRELGKKVTSAERVHAQYTGLIKISAGAVSDMAAFYDSMDRAAVYDGQSFDNMFMTSFIQQLIDAGWPVQAVLVDNGWLEVDAVSDIELYERLAQSGELEDLCALDG